MLVDFGDRIINTRHIVSAEPGGARGSRESWRLTLSTGEKIKVDDPVDELETMCGTIVPAQPGFVLVEAFLPGPGEEPSFVTYQEKPIIAFRVIGGTNVPQPITLAGEPLDQSDVRWIVRQPDGKGVDRDGVSMAVEAFKEDCASYAASRLASAA